MRAFIVHPRASPRKGRFATARTLPMGPDSPLIARPLLTPGPTRPLVHGLRLVARPLFALKASLVAAASWRRLVEIGTVAETTFGMVTGAVGTTTRG